MREGSVRIGVSGWRYAPWRGAFYPQGLRQRDELAHAARAFSTIEINGSFYSLQRPASWLAWHDATPDDFVFAVKGPRFVTHIKRLREIDAPLANFFASGVLGLRDKLGPVLWQFPPNFRFDPADFEPFLATLPHDTGQALTLARRHDHRVEGRTWLEPGRAAPAAACRRGPPSELRRSRLHGACCASTASPGSWPIRPADGSSTTTSPPTSSTCACTAPRRSTRAPTPTPSSTSGRRASGPGAAAPRRLRARLVAPEATPPRRARDVFCYFDNTDKLQAPLDAARLKARLGV